MNKYAVIIGVNQYHTSLGPLRYCCDDAELMRQTLLSTECGFTPDNVLLLTDRQDKDRQPTFGNIHSWLANWLTLPEPDDLLLFYFAGHGFYKNGTTLLVPSDATIHSLDITGIRLSYVQELIESSKARQKVLFLDACHSGSGRDVMPMAREFAQELETAEGVYTIASCKEDQISHECEDKEHGIFTWSLVDAIQTAEPDQDGRITLDAVFQQCKQNITNWCKSRCLIQTPIRISRTTDDIVLLKKHIVIQEPKFVNKGDVPKKTTEVIAAHVDQQPIPKIIRNWWDRIKEKDIQCISPDGGEIKRISYYVVEQSGMGFVHVRKGSYKIGSPDNEPGHYADEILQDIEISADFWVLSTPISNKMYHEYDPNHNSGTYKKFDLNKDDHPVVNVTWHEAIAYCKWLSKALGVTVHLPDEIQWEYFCRAGTTQSRYWGNDVNGVFCRHHVKNKKAFGFLSSRDDILGTVPVESYPSNLWGIYDCLGNVWEWCNNWYSADVKERKEEGKNKAARGGSWASSSEFCRAAARVKYPTNYRNQELGFRVVIVSEISR